MKAKRISILLVALPVILTALILFLIVQGNRQDQARKAQQIYTRQTQEAGQALLETETAQKAAYAATEEAYTAATETALSAQKSQQATQQAILQKEKDAALAGQLAAQAELLSVQSPQQLEVSALLAAESILRQPNGQADAVIRYALEKMPHPVAVVSDADSKAEYKYMWSVAFSADGKNLATGGSDAAHLWSLPDGKEVARIPHNFYVAKVLFSPDGIHAASQSKSKLFIWRIDNGQVVASIQHSGEIHDFAFSPDGNFLVSSGNDATTRIWSFQNEVVTEVASIQSNTDILRLAFHPNSKLLLTITEGSNMGGVQPEIWMYEMPTGQALKRWETGGSYPSGALFSPRGKYVATQDAQMIQIWDTNSGEEIARLEQPSLAIAFTPDGQSLAVASADEIKIWPFAKPGEGTVIIQQEKVNRLFFSPDGKHLAGISGEGVARVWRVNNGAEVAVLSHTGKVTDLAFSADGRYIASSSQDSTAKVMEIGSQPGRYGDLGIETGARVDGIAFSPDGRFVAASSQTGSFTLWLLSPMERKLLAEKLDGGVSKLVFSPDSAYVALGGDQSLHLYNTKTMQEVGPMEYPNERGSYLRQVAFSPDSKILATVDYDDTARLWDVTTGQELKRFALTSGGTDVVFTPDGKSLITANTKGKIQRWDLQTGQPEDLFELLRSNFGPQIAISPDGAYLGVYDDDLLHVFHLATKQQVFELYDPGASPFFYAVAFSPDNKTLATSGNDGMLRIWDFTASRELFHMQNENVARTMAYSQDGKYIVTQSDKVTSIWDANTGREVAHLPTSGMKAAISTDNRFVASGAQLWYWQPDDLLPFICRSVTRNLTGDEWTLYLGSEPYRKTCPDKP